MNLGLYRTQIIGVIGVILMVISGRALIMAPERLNLIEGFILRDRIVHVLNNLTQGSYEQIRIGILAFGGALLWSYFFGKKNLVKIFYCMIVVVVVKWAVDIFIISSAFNNTELRFTTIIMFIAGVALVKNNLLSDNNIPHSNENTSN